MTGATGYYTGLAAEQSVAQKYRASGFSVVSERFKTRCGEIDLIAEHNDHYYFVEVKSSKTFERAVERITPRQIARIRAAALEFLVSIKRPLETNMRFDAALVDGLGHIKVIPNAF
ncbi:UPF0102 protein [Amylibacter marinus]|uniref:UPF0102 protein GCM10007939_12850 n=1 Tax=Amylibacter marinus TaxID=1475483 RepID=A0ABQ5VUS1_9RHOB|nr:YraN family protein [Amylibacter marinus]GLQ35002.1 UPF0102 protein [Amylibacter marinus]